MSAFQQAVEQIATATAQPEHYVRQSLLSVMTAEEWDALSARIGELEAENDKLWADLTFCMDERNEARQIARLVKLYHPDILSNIHRKLIESWREDQGG